MKKVFNDFIWQIDAVQHHASFESEKKPETRMYQFDCNIRNEFGI